MSARITPDAVDARFSQLYAHGGLGLVLVGPDGETVDAVAMYPNTPWPTQSECAPTPNLPATLARPSTNPGNGPIPADGCVQQRHLESRTRRRPTPCRRLPYASTRWRPLVRRVPMTTSSRCATGATAISTSRRGGSTDAPPAVP